MKKYNANEVAMMLDISVPTLGNWYKFKREFPNDEKAKLLPDPIQKSARQKRYWTEDDIEKLKKFKSSITVGRNGFMGSVTQKYAKYKQVYDVRKEVKRLLDDLSDDNLEILLKLVHKMLEDEEAEKVSFSSEEKKVIKALFV